MAPPPFGPLEYLYVGSARFEEDVAYYRDVLGAKILWNLEGFGAHVAAFRVSPGPLLLIADHRPAPSVLPVYAVPNLSRTVEALRGRGWKPAGDAFEIPNGPCYLFTDPSGNQLAVFENVRPRPFEDAPAGGD